VIPFHEGKENDEEILRNSSEIKEDKKV